MTPQMISALDILNVVNPQQDVRKYLKWCFSHLSEAERDEVATAYLSSRPAAVSTAVAVAEQPESAPEVVTDQQVLDKITSDGVSFLHTLRDAKLSAEIIIEQNKMLLWASDLTVAEIEHGFKMTAPAKPKLNLNAKVETNRKQEPNPFLPTPERLTQLIAIEESQREAEETRIREEMEKSPLLAYPKFPSWVFRGSSIYEGLVKPVCDVNHREAEFMFMPALGMLLNYIGGRVRIKSNPGLPLTTFMISVGKKGALAKSSCINDAINYFRDAGIVTYGNPTMTNAEAQSLVWTAGSPEGLGKQMAKMNCKNGILFYDELGKMSAKAGIQGSNLLNDLLTMYEAGMWSNAVKSKKDTFMFEPGSYCISLFTCCTDRSFPRKWAQLQAGDTGLKDRFYFLFQPRELKARRTYTYVETSMNAVITRRLIDKAMSQGVYELDDMESLARALDKKALETRGELRAEKWGLALAIDLGRDSIDEDCTERGLAIEAYNEQVKRYLTIVDAENKYGAAQMQIVGLLQKQTNFQMPKHELERTMHFMRYAVGGWADIYGGLMKAGIIREVGQGKKGSPVMVQLIRVIFLDDDE